MPLVGMLASTGVGLVGAGLAFEVDHQVLRSAERAGWFAGAGGYPASAGLVLVLVLVPLLLFVGLRTLAQGLFAREAELRWEEWTFRRALGRVRADLQSELGEDERPLGILEVDGPAAERAPGLLFATQGLLVILAQALGTGAVSLAGSEPIWAEHHVLLGAFVFPLMVWTCGFFGPLAPLEVALILGLSALLPLALVTLVPGLSSWLAWNPLLWAVLAASLAMAVYHLLPRSRRFLLLSSRGVRVGRIEPGGVLTGLGFPRLPIALSFDPGSVRSTWTLARDGREPLRLRPGRTDPAQVVRTLTRAGFPLEVGGRGGREGIAGEVERLGALAPVPLILLALVVWLGAGFFHARSLFLGRVGAHLDRGRVSGAQGAEQTIAACEEMLASYPSSLAAQEVRIVQAMQSGKVAEAARWLAELTAALGRVGIPPILGSSGHGRFPETVAGVLPCFRRIYEPGRRGWEPNAQALASFRHGCAVAMGFPLTAALNDEASAVRSLLRAQELDPSSPAPVTVLAWHWLQGEAPRAALYEETLAEYQGRRAPLREVRASNELYRAVLAAENLSDALASVPGKGWRSLAGRLRSALPLELLDRALAGIRDDWLRVGHLDDWRPLAPALSAASWIRPSPVHQFPAEPGQPSCTGDRTLPRWHRLLLEPPRRAREVREAWPELEAAPDPRTARLTEDLRALLAANPDDLYTFFKRRPWLFGGSDGLAAPQGESAVRAMSVGLLRGE